MYGTRKAAAAKAANAAKECQICTYVAQTSCNSESADAATECHVELCREPLCELPVCFSTLPDGHIHILSAQGA